MQSLTSAFDISTVTGKIAAAAIPGGKIAAAIHYSASKQISELKAEAENRMKGVEKAQRTEEDLAKDTDVETLIHVSLGAARKVRAEDVKAYGYKKESDLLRQQKRDKIALVKECGVKHRRSSTDKQPLRTDKQQAQKKQLESEGGYDYQSDPIEDSPTFGVF